MTLNLKLAESVPLRIENGKLPIPSVNDFMKETFGDLLHETRVSK